LDQQHKLIPGEALIYENVDGVIYARYRDPPHNTTPRWIIGGDPVALQKLRGELFSWADWQEMMELSLKYPAIKTQMKKLVNLYYLCKENE
jgi:hypothetical protein